MLVLAFDTATPAVTVALHDGFAVVAEEFEIDSRRHGELLTPAICAMLKAAGATPADLTGIAVGTGPGPYTGLRVGLATAQALGNALGLPVDGICTLDVIAADAGSSAAGHEFIVATDARRREVYWARYSAAAERVGEPQVSVPALVPTGYRMAGQGPRIYADLVATGEVIEPQYPSAARLAEMAVRRSAEGIGPGVPEPLYLRRPDAREPGKPKRVTA